jgi:hypothetical protein
MVHNMYFSTYKNCLLVSYVFYVTTFTNTLHSIFGGLFYALFSDSVVPEDAWFETWTVSEFTKKISRGTSHKNVISLVVQPKIQ